MNPLTGKTALVTGGSRGTGRSVALRLAIDGALVAIHYGTDRTAAEATVREINDNGGRAFTVQADGMFERLDVVLGGKGLDILVNSDRAFTVVTRRALPMLNRDGRIINIGPASAALDAMAAELGIAIATWP